MGEKSAPINAIIGNFMFQRLKLQRRPLTRGSY